MTAPEQTDKKKQAARQAFAICLDTRAVVANVARKAFLTNIFGIAAGSIAASALQMPVLNALIFDTALAYSTVRLNKDSQILKNDFAAAFNAASPDVQRLLKDAKEKMDALTPLNGQSISPGHFLKTRPLWTLLSLWFSIPDSPEYLPGMLAGITAMDDGRKQRDILQSIYEIGASIQHKYPDIVNTYTLEA